MLDGRPGNDILRAMDVTPDRELTLSFDNQRAVVSPWGASLRRYYLSTGTGRPIDIVWGYSGASHKKGGQGDVLIPFPGRIAGGRYSFDGRTFQLECNDKEGPNAIHGFVRTRPWSVTAERADHVGFSTTLDSHSDAPKGYPFSLTIMVTYSLDQRGLCCEFRVTNVGEEPAPVGVGFHPYFTLGTDLIDDVEARIPASSFLEFDRQLAPTGRVISVDGSEWDHRTFALVGTKRFNHCYYDLGRDSTGMATASIRRTDNSRLIEVMMDEAFRAIVVYTGDAIPGEGRRAFAIEPMTCATDAFNHPEWGLKRLAVGESFSGRYVIRHQFG